MLPPYIDSDYGVTLAALLSGYDAWNDELLTRYVESTSDSEGLREEASSARLRYRALEEALIVAIDREPELVAEVRAILRRSRPRTEGDGAQTWGRVARSWVPARAV
jgi:hypothetical protein